MLFGVSQLYEDKAQVDVGEIRRSSAGFSKGVDRLVTRLNLLQWVIQHLKPGVKEARGGCLSRC